MCLFSSFRNITAVAGYSVRLEGNVMTQQLKMHQSVRWFQVLEQRANHSSTRPTQHQRFKPTMNLRSSDRSTCCCNTHLCSACHELHGVQKEKCYWRWPTEQWGGGWTMRRRLNREAARALCSSLQQPAVSWFSSVITELIDLGSVRLQRCVRADSRNRKSVSLQIFIWLKSKRRKKRCTVFLFIWSAERLHEVFYYSSGPYQPPVCRGARTAAWTGSPLLGCI